MTIYSYLIQKRRLIYEQKEDSITYYNTNFAYNIIIFRFDFIHI